MDETGPYRFHTLNGRKEERCSHVYAFQLVLKRNQSSVCHFPKPNPKLTWLAQLTVVTAFTGTYMPIK